MDLSKFFRLSFCPLLLFAALNVIILQLNMKHDQEFPQKNEKLLKQVNQDFVKAFQVCNQSKFINNTVVVSNTSLTKTINIQKINYIINGSSICNKSPQLRLLIVIITPQENYQRRYILRKTWTSPVINSTNLGLMFFMGVSTKIRVKNQIIYEHKRFQDVVVADFNESYRNLSLKTFLMLKWIHDFCPNVDYVLKCDDDMFINIYNLIDFIKDVNPNRRSFYGRLMHNFQPVRDENSIYAKWIVTPEEYSGVIYPDFVSGPSYLFGTAGVSDLLSVCAQLPYLHLEDVFVTGVCASKANYCRRNNAQFINDKISNIGCSVLSLISAHQVYGAEMMKLWRIISNFDAYKACTNKPEEI